MSVRITSINTEDLINRYHAGTSIKRLAEENNVSRQVIYRLFRENSVPVRNRSDAMYVRMASLSKEEKQNLTEHANKALRGSKRAKKGLYQAAKTRQKSMQYIGAGELELIELLKEENINSIHQLAINQYNIDIAIRGATIAVEIKIGTSIDPMTLASEAKKIKELTKLGWFVIYVMVKVPADINSWHSKKIASYIKEFSLNPSLGGQYWVIGRDSKVYP